MTESRDAVQFVDLAIQTADAARAFVADASHATIHTNDIPHRRGEVDRSVRWGGVASGSVFGPQQARIEELHGRRDENGLFVMDGFGDGARGWVIEETEHDIVSVWKTLPDVPCAFSVHYHPHITETACVVSGFIDFWGGSWHTHMEAGQRIDMPWTQPHGGLLRGELIVIFSPPHRMVEIADD